METKHFLKQHIDLLKISQELSGMLTEEQVKKESEKTHDLLFRLDRYLFAHLMFEDEYVYPTLLNIYQDADARRLAQNYSEEVGQLSKNFTEHIKRWPIAEFITKKPLLFIIETMKLLDALRNRIDKENKELYVIADRVSKDNRA